ncbi:catechol 2,3-dioxygenase-like lactoylglutathione lyase family enzyme [Mycetocola sp. BIGb0189]|uniref:VOC family protein n=1 Tax=Mycetocola sp. BIGb0189 TaxID=2940604 RepID=UPI002169CDB8|nr:VOC family protein [Mycetocola sp. BIGb0189]MCS4275684.1 catechol 2,3-dioxygenase-like lactoylglutathione lyase family enzyme [Mycetocola sp. BIGb0189]
MTLTLGFIGLVTSDMPAALAFYRALGVDIPAGAETAPHVDAVLPDGTTLAWDTVEVIRSFDPNYAVPTGGHRIALAFAHGSPAEVDATFTRLEEAGYPGHVAPWDAPWGQRYATVLDPDGNSIDLFAPLSSAHSAS